MRLGKMVGRAARHLVEGTGRFAEGAVAISYGISKATGTFIQDVKEGWKERKDSSTNPEDVLWRDIPVNKDKKEG